MMTRRKALKDFAYIAGVSLFLPRGYAQDVLPVRRRVVAAAAPAGSCPADGSPDITALATNDDEDAVAIDTDRFYVGQKLFTDASNRIVCKIGFYMEIGAGDISGKFYRAAIWTMTGNNLNAVISNGYSDQITGIVAGGWKDFAWTGSMPSITGGGTTYALTVGSYGSGTTTPASPDLTNRAVVWADTPSSAVAGSKAVWNTAGTLETDSTTYDSSIRLYWYD